MIPKGINILVQPEPNERKIGSIIIPDTATPQNMEWARVIDGNGHIEDGMQCLIFGRRSHESKGKKIVSFKSVIFWRHQPAKD